MLKGSIGRCGINSYHSTIGSISINKKFAFKWLRSYNHCRSNLDISGFTTKQKSTMVSQIF